MGNEIIIAEDRPRSMVSATSDPQLIGAWLANKVSEKTRQSYANTIRQFMTYLGGKSLASITVEDVAGFRASLAHMAPATRNKMIATVKSLLSFGAKTQYLQFNVGAVVELRSVKDDLARRIITEEQVISMINLTTNARDKFLLRLLYVSGARVSELVTLKWEDTAPNGQAGQVTLYGKRGKTRHVLLTKRTWEELQTIERNSEWIFPSPPGKGEGHMSAVHAWRIVSGAAKRAGIVGNVSPHWLRHAHASHSLDRGASVAVVRDTLGHSSLAVTSRYTHAKPTESSAQKLIL